VTGSLALEEGAHLLLARHQPVAKDLRGAIMAIQVAADIERMGSLARHVAEIARRHHPGHAVPAELMPVFGQMGTVAHRLAEGSGCVLADLDATTAARLDVDDDAMDALQRSLFRTLLGGWPYGVQAAIDAALLGRYYERFGDHAVAIADTVVYFVTGVPRHQP
jgi:phosphate transport system protein